jgi:hypothetical protein
MAAHADQPKLPAFAGQQEIAALALRVKRPATIYKRGVLYLKRYYVHSRLSSVRGRNLRVGLWLGDEEHVELWTRDHKWLGPGTETRAMTAPERQALISATAEERRAVRDVLIAARSARDDRVQALARLLPAEQAMTLPDEDETLDWADDDAAAPGTDDTGSTATTPKPLQGFLDAAQKRETRASSEPATPPTRRRRAPRNTNPNPTQNPEADASDGDLS